MPILKSVHKWERVVPVRFARAPHATDPTISTGPYDANAPEPDDRGFLPHTVGGASFPVGLDEAVAAAARPETRVRLIRMDMENAAQLFVTSSNLARFEITQPATNAVLPSTKEMMIKIRALTAGTANLEVRFGSIAGPIIHQMEVVLNPVIAVRVVAHVPTINGAAFINPAPPPAGAPFPTPQGTAFPAQSARTDASIRALIDGANLIYFPYGIRLTLDAVVNRGNLVTLTRQGMVDDLTNEFTTAQVGRLAHAINAYFIPQIANGAASNPINSTAGVATSARGNPTTFALFVADWATSFEVIAHEIGHVFDIVNDPTNEFVHINTMTDPAIPGTGRDVRYDTISRRRLLWAYTDFFPGNAAPAPRGHNLAIRDDVGYGNNTPGGMFTIKGLSNDKTDHEMADVRRNGAALP
jgi:hypothetical protein